MDETALGFECVLPCEDHAKLVMQWRNDHETLKASFHQSPKIWESFWPEFQREYFTIPDLRPLFVLKEGQRVAFLRFRPQTHPLDPPRRCFELSIVVSPNHRRQGIAAQVLRQLPQLVSGKGYDDIYVDILKSNLASLKVFQEAGFTKVDEVEKRVEGVCFSVIRLLYSLTDHAIRKKTFVIAEAGSNWRAGNYREDLEQAKALIEVAAQAGADAVKFQVFRADSVYVKNAGQSDYLMESKIKENIHALFEDLSMPYEMIPKLALWCQEAGVQFMATPFSIEDFAAVDPYVSVHKIASYELGHLRLLELAARCGKPTIMSTGAADEGDIAWALETFYQNGGKEAILLQCTAKYPAPIDAMNLRAIVQLKRRFGTSVGLSDHSRHSTLGPTLAVALGASVVEKHFTLDNNLPGPDHAFALNPRELEEMIQSIRKAEEMLGTGEKAPLPAEEELRLFARRAVQATRDILVGDELVEGVNMAILRPGKQTPGLHPKFITEMEGKKACRDIPAGAGIQFGDF